MTFPSNLKLLELVGGEGGKGAAYGTMLAIGIAVTMELGSISEQVESIADRQAELSTQLTQITLDLSQRVRAIESQVEMMQKK